MRTSLICLSVLLFTACAAGNGTRSVRTAAKVPVYSCVDSRIKQARHCRERYGVSHPSVLVPGPGNTPTIPGSK